MINTYPERPLADERFRLHHLLDEPVLVAVPRGHRLAARRTVRLTELADEAWIAGSPRLSETLLAASLRHGFRPRVDFVAREWTAKLGFVAAGLGVTLVPALAARAAPSDIVLLRLHADEAPIRQIFAATVAGRSLTAPVERFIAALRDETLDTPRHLRASRTSRSA